LERRRPPEVKVEGVDGEGASSVVEGGAAVEPATSAGEAMVEHTVVPAETSTAPPASAEETKDEEEEVRTDVAETPSLAV
jgi:hypothetical protein